MNKISGDIFKERYQHLPRHTEEHQKQESGVEVSWVQRFEVSILLKHMTYAHFLLMNKETRKGIFRQVLSSKV